MTQLLDLTPDELLSTTRSVRHRLDLTRPVPRHLVDQCVDLATQAPTGRNRQRWHFLVVDDPGRRREVSEIFRRSLLIPSPPVSERDIERANVNAESMPRMLSGLDHLTSNMADVPAIVVACIEGRTDAVDTVEQARTWGSILPALWSFMLAARARGLGTCWTTTHLKLEREAADVLGIPYASVMQVALTPLAYTVGTTFRPAKRIPRDRVLHWNHW